MKEESKFDLLLFFLSLSVLFRTVCFPIKTLCSDQSPVSSHKHLIFLIMYENQFILLD